jgi:hypothetical protein
MLAAMRRPEGNGGWLQGFQHFNPGRNSFVGAPTIFRASLQVSEHLLDSFEEPRPRFKAIQKRLAHSTARSNRFPAFNSILDFMLPTTLRIITDRLH